MAGYHPLLAYHGEWHLRAAWSSLRFADEELPRARQTRDAIKPATPSAAAQAKKADRITTDGLPVQSFDSLMMHLASQTRNHCRLSSPPSGSGLTQITEPTPLQARAMKLLDLYPGPGN